MPLEGLLFVPRSIKKPNYLYGFFHRQVIYVEWLLMLILQAPQLAFGKTCRIYKGLN